ncbi:cupin domain-containing protein [Saliniramus fredricksonii]|uniref:Cupin domain-containing protein n=1 Tax=Saliniramus fredricksonii TaxID=1653334 RepID=A0ABY0K3H7_9HYPH|nr:cupin domain-containing protein [Saliniramus fredricksonii]SCC77980.1 Cupin domain-containing protein [Saliniramus fredricksonii]
MEYVKKFETSKLKYEYGLDGIRTFPWEGIVPPFGGGYCIVRPGTSTLNHVNIPDDEDEMFIAVQGDAVVVIDGIDHPVAQGDIVMIPRGLSHFVRNDGPNAFHLYTIWWSHVDVDAYRRQEEQTAAG